MPIACEFEYHKPKTMKEALALLAKYKGKLQPLAGGTDLIVWLKEGVRSPEHVMDLKALPLDGIQKKGDAVRIGALTTFAELIESPLIREKFPVLWEAARSVASTGVRNRATMAGNLCSAVPCMDSAPPLLVYDAVVELQSPKKNRELPLEKFFKGPKKTALAPDELLVAVRLPLPVGKAGGAYLKLGRYRGEDLAQVGLAVLALPGEWRLAWGAVGPVPARSRLIESLLAGKKLSAELLREAGQLVAKEISPITDIRSSKEYRLHMAVVMLERGLKAAAERQAGRGPAAGESLL